LRTTAARPVCCRVPAEKTEYFLGACKGHYVRISG